MDTKNWLETPEQVAGALVALYHRQTAEEQYGNGTVDLNGRGFNAPDAEFGSNLARQVLQHGWLSPKQIDAARRMLAKYARQLDGECTPHPLNGSCRCCGKTDKVVDGFCWCCRQQKEASDKDEALLQRLKELSTSSTYRNPPPSVNLPARRVGEVDGWLALYSPYDADFVAWIKRSWPNLKDRRFDSAHSKRWLCRPIPGSDKLVDKMEENGFVVSGAARALVQPAHSPENQAVKLPPEVVEGLYPFQREGLARINALKGRVLLADEMGLGKTVQALAYLRMHPDLRPVVVVCPASLKLNWAREAGTWLPKESVQVLSGSGPAKSKVGLDGHSLYVINYDILAGWKSVLWGKRPPVLVVDECHYAKNPKAQRTKALLDLARDIPHVIAMSGTPLVNRPMEVYTAISMVDPSLFASRYQFGMRYCDPVPNRWSGGMDFNGASNTAELNRLLTQRMMIRRTKAEVLKDLPAKTRAVVPLELDNLKEYQGVEAGVLAVLGGDGQVRQLTALTQIEALKQVAYRGKLAAAKAWIADFLEADGKLVVFALHHEAIDVLSEEFRDVCVVIDGRTPVDKRQGLVDRFQQVPACRLFIGNVKAAGVGITLTASSNVAFLELPWTPGELTQAEDRCHRIGQQDAVTAYYLLAQGTIDERIARLLHRKAAVLEQVLDGRAEGSDRSVLDDLLLELTSRSTEA